LGFNGKALKKNVGGLIGAERGLRLAASRSSRDGKGVYRSFQPGRRNNRRSKTGGFSRVGALGNGARFVGDASVSLGDDNAPSFLAAR